MQEAEEKPAYSSEITIGSAVLTAGKTISQVHSYDSGQREFLFWSLFCSHTSPRDINSSDTVWEHCTSANYKLDHFWCASLPWLIVVGSSSVCTLLFPQFFRCFIETMEIFTIIFPFLYLPDSVLLSSSALDYNLYADYTRSTYDQCGMCSCSCPKT